MRKEIVSANILMGESRYIMFKFIMRFICTFCYHKPCDNKNIKINIFLFL